MAFTAKKTFLGGIFPFKIENCSFKNFDSISVNTFKTETAEKGIFLEHKKRIYTGQKNWTIPARTLFLDFKIVELELSNNRKFSNLDFKAYVSIYELGFTSITFWIDFYRFSLSYEEIIEVSALIKGSDERIDKQNSAASNICIMISDEQIQVKNFVSLCNRLAKILTSELKGGITNDDFDFVYPLVYVGRVADCTCANELREKYGKEISGIIDLWHISSPWIKEEVILENLKADIYPFSFGLSFLSTTCTVEFHPNNFSQFIKKNKLKEIEQHFSERTILSFFCEVPVVQMFILKEFEKDLNDIFIKIKSNIVSNFLNPISIYYLISKSTSIDRIKTEMTLSISRFRDIHITKKSYLPETIKKLRHLLGTDDIEKNIETKLTYLQNYISTNYSLITTIVVIIISIFATLASLIQAFIALSS